MIRSNVRRLVLVAAMGTVPLAVSAQPGSRMDATPWFGLGSVVSHVLDLQAERMELQEDQAREIEELRAERSALLQELRGAQREAPTFGMPLITDSSEDYEEAIQQTSAAGAVEEQEVRTDYQKALTELDKEIEAALASPPGSSAKERMDRAKVDTASREAMEVHNALVNLQEAVKRLNERLVAERSNYDLAVTTYKAQQQLCRYVIRMNQGLRQRIDHVYAPRFESLLRRVDIALDTTADSAAMSVELKQREAANLKRLREALERGVPKLESHKRWAAQNIEQVSRQLDIYENMYRNVSIMKDAAAVVAQVNADIAQVEFRMPELIEYELEGGDFRIGAAD